MILFQRVLLSQRPVAASWSWQRSILHHGSHFGATVTYRDCSACLFALWDGLEDQLCLPSAHLRCEPQRQSTSSLDPLRLQVGLLYSLFRTLAFRSTVLYGDGSKLSPCLEFALLSNSVARRLLQSLVFGNASPDSASEPGHATRVDDTKVFTRRFHSCSSVLAFRSGSAGWTDMCWTGGTCPSSCTVQAPSSLRRFH